MASDKLNEVTDLAKWNAAVRHSNATRAGSPGRNFLVERMGRTRGGELCRGAACVPTMAEAEDLARIARSLPRAVKVNVYRWTAAGWAAA